MNGSVRVLRSRPSDLRSNKLFAEVGYLLAVMRSLLLTTLLGYGFGTQLLRSRLRTWLRVLFFCEDVNKARGSGEVTKVAPGAMQSGEVTEVASSLLLPWLGLLF